MNTSTQETLQSLKADAKRLALLYFEASKYTVAEKSVMLFGALACAVIMLVLGVGVLVFITMSLISLLSEVVPLPLAYLIMALVLVLLALAVYLLRVPLIYNHMARFVSRLFLDPPTHS